MKSCRVGFGFAKPTALTMKLKINLTQNLERQTVFDEEMTCENEQLTVNEMNLLADETDWLISSGESNVR